MLIARQSGLFRRIAVKKLKHFRVTAFPYYLFHLEKTLHNRVDKVFEFENHFITKITNLYICLIFPEKSRESFLYLHFEGSQRIGTALKKWEKFIDKR